MYNCGPTVYWYAHIGNFRAYIFADVLRRYLEYKDYKVNQVMNITDVGHMTSNADEGEDKMEVAAKKEGKTPKEIAEFYTNAFIEDWKILNLEEPIKRPKASEHIKDMLNTVQILLDKGYAYEANGSVYFEISKFPEYGKLSHNTMKDLKVGAGGRVEKNSDKKNQLDFALWINDDKHLMNWKSPWSEKGYPGWHLECSVMANKYLGKTIDIKTGGVDNIFPHHECEIAQSEAANDVPYSKYYIHTRHLIIDGKKMSKSVGNFYTIKDLIKRGRSPKAIRYLLLSAHYRSQLNLTEESLDSAEKTVTNLLNFIGRIQETKIEERYNDDLKEKINEVKLRFENSMDDDLNVPEALSAIFDLISETNKAIDEKKINKNNLDEVYEAMMKFDKVLGILEHKKEKIPKVVLDLANKREEARQNKNWKEADKIRDEIKTLGYIIDDSSSGPRLKKV